jgi:hypothetical protein
MNLGKLIRKAAPIALGAFAPGIGAAIAPGLTPFMQSAIASGGLGLLMGQKPKEALLSGVLGGVASGIGGQAKVPVSGYDDAAMLAAQQAAPTGRTVAELAKSGKIASTSGGAGFGGFSGAAKAAEAKTMSGDLLKSLNFAGEGEGSLLFKLLNSQMGEGLAAGLLAQALAAEEEEAQSQFESRPFGASYEGQQLAGGQLGGINYADGGEAYFPRRNGGIDPSEGSGKKDDVPAMLMAGEFVMTRDAVKGMGDGDLRKGIGRMYDVMDNLERMA